MFKALPPVQASISNSCTNQHLAQPNYYAVSGAIGGKQKRLTADATPNNVSTNLLRRHFGKCVSTSGVLDRIGISVKEK